MWPAIIAAGASLLGGVMANRSNAKQAAAANTLSQAQFEQQNIWNRENAEIDYQRSIASMNQANQLNLSNMERANELQVGQNRELMAFTDEQARRQMGFQERLSNTAHQREVNDLRLAGLNPILSGTGGMGSITPGGAMGSGHAGGPSSPSVQSAGARIQGASPTGFQQARLQDVISPAMSTALQASRALEEIQLVRDQQEATKAGTLRTLAQGRREAVAAALDESGFLERERQAVLEKTTHEGSKVAGESQSARVKGEMDARYVESERQAALGFLAAQSQNMRATARQSEVKAGLDERLSEIERIIHMGEGASSAIGNLIPKIKLWESPRTKGKEFSLGR